MKPETRTFEATVELREGTAEQPGRTIYGLAVPYDSPITVLIQRNGKTEKAQEQFRAGSFQDQLADQSRNVIGDAFHDSTIHLASSRNGTLRLQDSPEGLRYEMDVAETRAGDDVLALVRSGEIRGASISFLPADGGETISRDKETGQVTREITKANLYAVTVTPRPAYADTVARLREELLADLDEEEQPAEAPARQAARQKLRRMIAGN